MPRRPSDFGAALRSLRESHKKTQGEVAEALGVHAQVISNLERGQVALLPANHLTGVRRALHLTPIEFAYLRRARIMTILQRALEGELAPQPIRKMKAIIAVSRPGRLNRASGRRGRAKVKSKRR